MKPRSTPTMSLALLSALAFMGPIACAQTTAKSIVIHPSADTSSKQQLELKGVRTTSDAVGVRVFLDPGTDGKLDPESKSYLGSFYFTDHQQGNTKRGSFVVVLPKKVTGPTRVVLYAISPKGSPVAGPVEVQEAKIRPADNTAFQ